MIMANADVISLVIVIAIALFTSITAPLIISGLTSRRQAQENLRMEVIRKAEKEEDWARQDRVAAIAATAAERLATAQATTIKRTDEVARLAALDSRKVQDKLDRMETVGLTTHALVNSDMTEARESELTAARALLEVLERIVGAREAGRNPEDTDIEAIREARLRIRALEALIADRKAAATMITDATAQAALTQAKDRAQDIA
jgi:hypothetical protein